MSRPVNRYDNAIMDSFWATLKTELLQGRAFTTHAEACSALFSYFEVFYNRRLHGALGFQTPVE